MRAATVARHGELEGDEVWKEEMSGEDEEGEVAFGGAVVGRLSCIEGEMKK